MDYSTYYQAQQPYVGFTPTPALSQGSTGPSEDGFNPSPPANYGQNYDAFSAFDRDILAAQGHSQVYGQNGLGEEAPAMHRSSSEEKDMTPQQSKRKAQNRAAQRAFRERKERHVKELEEKLSNLEANSTNVQTENERLKKEIQKMSTENQILRATSAVQVTHQPASAPLVDVGPVSYNPTDFYDVVLEPHKNKTPSHRISNHPETGEPLLGAAAAWDMITSDPLYKNGEIDITAVSEFLKPNAKCDGQGPVFPESAIRKAIEMSACLSKDELI